MTKGVPSLPEPTTRPPPPPTITHHETTKNKVLKPEPIYEAINAEKLTNLKKNENKNDTIIEPTHFVEKKKNSITPTLCKHELDPEKEQRRKNRVEKKIQEININEEGHKNIYVEEVYNILEYAENYFNTHEILIDGTLMATLTRKGKKSNDVMPKFDMITFFKSDKIPTSHIHMYDPENVSLACNIFRVSLNLIRASLFMYFSQ